MKKVSDKKRQELADERPIRAILNARSQGRCELCGSKLFVAPHEIIFRSKGGKMSLTNSIMLCQLCHREEQTRRTPAEKLIAIVAKANKRHEIEEGINGSQGYSDED